MFGYDDEIEELEDELRTLREELEDLIPDSPQFREIELDIFDLEDRVEEARNREPSFEEALELAQSTDSPTDWEKVREIGSPQAFSRLSFASPAPQPPPLIQEEEEQDDFFDFFELDLDVLNDLIGDFFRDVF